MIKKTGKDNYCYFSSLPSIVAVVSVSDADLALSAAKALIDGGIRAIELALRSDTALESIGKIRKEVPQMIVGAGTVINPAQVQEVIDAGAVFAVTPGFNKEVAEKAILSGLPFAPGIATPSEIEAALGLGLKVMKVFPAKHLGGIPYMKSMYTPYAHLGIRFIPLGGLDAEDVVPCISEKMIVSIGGSWIARKEDIENHRWDIIIQKAREAVALVRKSGGRI
jgi:2-dehydro-3-deoxyphosphogluconate aldolase/(4S)-4-hydroxy-2-oxoglutarate aldolase